MGKKVDQMTAEELRAELVRLQDNLCDLEETHHFTFSKTTVHIGAEQAEGMQQEFEEECRLYREQIAAVERLLRSSGGG
jgi:hypothetical protein